MSKWHIIATPRHAIDAAAQEFLLHVHNDFQQEIFSKLFSGNRVYDPDSLTLWEAQQMVALYNERNGKYWLYELDTPHDIEEPVVLQFHFTKTL